MAPPRGSELREVLADVAVDAELLVADQFGAGELAVAEVDCERVELPAKLLFGGETLDDGRGIEVDVVLHLGDGLGVGADLDHGVDGVAECGAAAGGEEADVRAG